MCGHLISWDRSETGGTPKSFGFAKYSSGDAAQRALRVLNGVSIGNEELLVSPLSSLRRQLSQHGLISAVVKGG